MTAIGTRLLLWQDTRANFAVIFNGMVDHHQNNARLLANGNLKEFITGPAPPGDANVLTYPPGYPILVAGISMLVRDADLGMRLFQVLCDTAAAILLFFLSLQFLPRGAAVIGALLAALSPQLGYYSLILLPDALATVPIVAALYFIIRATKNPNLIAVATAGVCVGLSCWLRSNALMLAPFLAVVLFIVMWSQAAGKNSAGVLSRKPWTYSAVLVLAFLVVISPITLRNMIVFHHFIPLSLGAGQMLNVGISDYDKTHRFGLPANDLETVVSEAERFNRPDYKQSLFGGNGVERDQRRLANGAAVIKAHPLWFASIAGRRALSMLKLERVPRVATQAAPIHRLRTGMRQAPVWKKEPREMVELFAASDNGDVSTTDNEELQIKTSASQRAGAIGTIRLAVEPDTDYVVTVPLRIESGNLLVSVVTTDGKIIASSPVQHSVENANGFVQLPVAVAFVTGSASTIDLAFSFDRNRPVQTTAGIGAIELYKLGPSALTWTSYVRSVVHVAQSFFVTAWIVPIAFVGALLLIMAGRKQYLLIIAAVPLYYMCFQSVLHTEYRYVTAIQYSFFVCAGAALYWTGSVARRSLERTK